jgi:hypothetical protein
LTAPEWVPRQEDLDVLYAEIRAATLRRVAKRLIPGGTPIGAPGDSWRVRELPGGLSGAQRLFADLSVGGIARPSSPNITVVELPARAGYVTPRPQSTSGGPAIDINVPEIPFIKIHFN